MSFNLVFNGIVDEIKFDRNYIVSEPVAILVLCYTISIHILLIMEHYLLFVESFYTKKNK